MTTTLENVTHCDLCGCGRFKPELVADGWNLVRCRHCQLVMTSPRRSAEACSELYSQEYYEGALGYCENQLQSPLPDDFRLISTLHKHVIRSRTRGRHSSAIETAQPAPIRGLDIGCGHGRLVAAMDQLGWQGYGIEPSVSACEEGKREGRRLFAGTLESVDSMVNLPNDFSVIMSLHVLEHAASPADFLRRCWKLLEPGGWLLLEVPDFGSPTAQKLGANWRCLHPHLHNYQFTRASLDQYLRRTGFRPMQWQRCGGRGFLDSRPQSELTATGVNTTEQPISPPVQTSLKRRVASQIKATAFAARKWVYWIPGSQQFARWVLWEGLKQGESIRVLSQKPLQPGRAAFG